MNMSRNIFRITTVLTTAFVSCALYADSFDGYADSGSGGEEDSVLVQSPTINEDGEVFISDELTGDMTWSEGTLAGCGKHECRGCQHCNRRMGWTHSILGRCGNRCSSWTAQIDALMLWQGNIPSFPLLTDTTVAVGDPVALNANQAQTEMAAGPRFALFYNVDPSHAIEGNYFYVDGLDGRASVPTGGTYSPVSIPQPPATGPGTITGATLLTEGLFKSAEINYRWRNTDALTWLIGFRWVEWNQTAQLDGQSGPTTSFSINEQTGNDLYGGQFGADLLFWDAGGRFRLNGIAKAGIFGNHAYQRASGSDDVTTYEQGTVYGDQVSFFGEVGMYGDIAITRWLSWRTGYVLFWGTGLALPAENLSLAGFPPATYQINISESLLVHGVTTGFEARW